VRHVYNVAIAVPIAKALAQERVAGIERVAPATRAA
jgi:hypothetical protein